MYICIWKRVHENLPPRTATLDSPLPERPAVCSPPSPSQFSSLSSSSPSIKLLMALPRERHPFLQKVLLLPPSGSASPLTQLPPAHKKAELAAVQALPYPEITSQLLTLAVSYIRVSLKSSVFSLSGSIDLSFQQDAIFTETFPCHHRYLPASTFSTPLRQPGFQLRTDHDSCFISSQKSRSRRRSQPVQSTLEQFSEDLKRRDHILQSYGLRCSYSSRTSLIPRS